MPSSSGGRSSYLGVLCLRDFFFACLPTPVCPSSDSLSGGWFSASMALALLVEANARFRATAPLCLNLLYAAAPASSPSLSDHSILPVLVFFRRRLESPQSSRSIALLAKEVDDDGILRDLSDTETFFVFLGWLLRPSESSLRGIL